MRIVITFQRRGDASYLPLIEMAFASAKKFGYETVMVGPDALCADHHIRFTPDMEPLLMNWILAAQLAFIVSPLFDQPSVIFSPDALVVKHLEPVFREMFDVAFTDRKNPRWPINNGVIYLKPAKKNQLGAFWREALRICRGYPVETQEWYGDQQSVHDAYMQGYHLGLGVNVALLPCSTYNASPLRITETIDKQLLNQAYVIHFKGKRKGMMQKYWDLICTRI